MRGFIYSRNDLLAIPETAKLGFLPSPSEGLVGQYSDDLVSKVADHRTLDSHYPLEDWMKAWR